MGNLHKFNEYALDKLRKVDGKEELSNLLLISPLLDGKIMYIGQETNCWQGALNESNYTASDLEELYYEKFSSCNFQNTSFWKFIREVFGKYDVSENIVWTNALIAGKKDSIGRPLSCNKIKDISIENLIAIYECFNIEKIICVAGPFNPYYDIYTSFLRKIGKNIEGYPCKKQGIVYSDDGESVYLYHPQYLRRINIYDKSVEEIKKFVKK